MYGEVAQVSEFVSFLLMCHSPQLRQSWVLEIGCPSVAKGADMPCSYFLSG